MPGGLRLAAWRGGQIERVAPVLEAGDLPALVAEAAEQELLPAAPDAPLPEPGLVSRQPGAHGRAARRAARRDAARRQRADRALGDAAEPRLGAPGGPRDAASEALHGGLCGTDPERSGRTSDHGHVPLTLVTGPANAAKAGEVLGGLRGRLGDEPILVVPSLRDVEHAQRDLADRGAVFGVSVLRFDWLFEEIARRAGHVERVASDVQRELILEEAVRRARLELLAESAAQPGFVRAAARFVAELGRATVDPARFTRALRTWAGDGPRRALRRGGRRRSSAATATGWRRPGWPTRAVRPAGARRARGATRRAGAARRCSCTASTTSSASSSTRSSCSPATAARTWSPRSPYEPGRAPSRRSRARTRSCSRAGARERRAGAARRSLRARVARGAAPHRAHLFEDDAAARSGGRGDPLPRRRRPARRDRAGRRARAGSAARGRRAGRRRGRAAPAGASTRRCSSRCSAPTTSRSRSTARVPLGHTGLGPGCWR